MSVRLKTDMKTDISLFYVHGNHSLFCIVFVLVSFLLSLCTYLIVCLCLCCVLIFTRVHKLTGGVNNTDHVHHGTTYLEASEQFIFKMMLQCLIGVYNYRIPNNNLTVHFLLRISFYLHLLQSFLWSENW